MSEIPKIKCDQCVQLKRVMNTSDRGWMSMCVNTDCVNIGITGGVESPVAAYELKKRCYEIVRQYFGQPISKELKREICSAVHGELIKAFSEILIKKEPTDIRILSFGGEVIILHGKLYLDDWIDDVWGPPVMTGNIHRRIRKD